MRLTHHADNHDIDGIHTSLRFTAETLGNARAHSLEHDEVFALCGDADPTITLLNYLLVTCRDDGGRLRLRPVASMHPRAQELFFTHFDPQKLADLASDASVAAEVQAAAATVLDCCTTGGWRVSRGNRQMQVGQVAGLVVQRALHQGQRDRAIDALSVFAHVDRETSSHMVDCFQ